ncbi:MAG: RpiB/LacA/LacB family sugar-phosphate isomerase [Dehalococcoidia bacterium]
MRIAIGSDEATAVTQSVIDDLRERGHELELVGALDEGQDSRWPVVGASVGRLIRERACDEGVLFCFTGTGVSMAANKLPGIRAALCADAQTAAGARRWNHANVLALSLRTTTTAQAKEILDAWFSAPKGDGEDAEMVEMLRALEETV